MAKQEPISVRIARLRKHKKWTKYRLAATSGVNRSTVGRIEAGLIEKPEHETVCALAAAFGVTIGQVRGTEAWPRGGDS
jgi:transcriptional regulator with XRE-family HTH domain